MVDAALLQAVASIRTPLLTQAAVSLTALGSVSFTLVAIAGLYLGGERDTAVLATVAAGVTAVVEMAVNAAVARPRPAIVPVLLPTGSGASFPSGHTALAFMLATVLSRRYGRTAPLYVLAAFVGVSRVYLGLHYPSDVAAGAVLGTAAGLLVYRYRETILSGVNRYI
ncbi:MAG: phosphatase PAP2 family protein [Candidatus Nanohaloarchaea archaeon]